jgi:purine-nucleoside/S-methyl-5'-thioadenosine phosphorylase / adenosine deaminase
MLLRSPLLARAGFRHAFFTRLGGASRAPFDSLNFGAPAEGDEESLQANVEIAAKTLAIEPSDLFVLMQVHGRDARRVSRGEDRDQVRKEKGDALVATSPGIACGVKVADCMPVLVGDNRTGAVAAIHSGWQGTVANVIEAGVIALREAIGDRGDLVAAIGPHIGVCCFEVGPDVADKLARCSDARGVVDDSRGPRPHVDLGRIAHAQLAALGLGDAAIDHVSGCTMCEPSRFYSFRRDRERSGRHLAAIVTRDG